MYFNQIWKSLGFVQFGADLTHFGSRSYIPATCYYLIHPVLGHCSDGDDLDAHQASVSLGEDVRVTRPVQCVGEEIRLCYHANHASFLYSWRKVVTVVIPHLKNWGGGRSVCRRTNCPHEFYFIFIYAIAVLLICLYRCREPSTREYNYQIISYEHLGWGNNSLKIDKHSYRLAASYNYFKPD